MGTGNLVRNLTLGALGIIAAAAIACSGGANDEAASTGGSDAFGVEGRVETDGGLSTLNVGAPDKAGAPQPGVAESRASSGAGSVGQGPVSSPPALQMSSRKIVQTASLRLQVEEVGAGFEEVGRIATAAGGFVASSKFSYVEEKQVASVTIRVPTDNYQSVLSQLRGLAEKVDAEDSNSSDVTEEYTDLESRLRNLQATYDQLLTLLGRAQTVTDILTVQDRLNSVTGEMEQVKGRMKLLDNLTDLSTVTVHLRPVAGAAGGSGDGVNLGETIAEAWDDSLAFLGGVVEDVLTVVVFAWWVPVLAAPLAVVWGLSRGRGRAPAAVD